MLLAGQSSPVGWAAGAPTTSSWQSSISNHPLTIPNVMADNLPDHIPSLDLADFRSGDPARKAQ
ncbi:MAG: hypothetical protein EOO57_07480, partial [Hymenobacter sp.]